jgi:hypothetical protein
MTKGALPGGGAAARDGDGEADEPGAALAEACGVVEGVGELDGEFDGSG